MIFPSYPINPPYPMDIPIISSAVFPGGTIKKNAEPLGGLRPLFVAPDVLPDPPAHGCLYGLYPIFRHTHQMLDI